MQPSNRRPPQAPSRSSQAPRPPQAPSQAAIDKGKRKWQGAPPPSSQSQSSMNQIDGAKKEKAHWDEDSTRIYCELCAEEVFAGNRPGTHLNKLGWENVAKNFHRRTGKRYDVKQFKNKWEKLRYEYTSWKSLQKETGLGWDHEKNTVAADKEWWDGKEKVGEFRGGGIKNETELEVMFSKTYVTDDVAWNPYSEIGVEFENEPSLGESAEDQTSNTIEDLTSDGIDQTMGDQTGVEDTENPKEGQSTEARRRNVKKAKKSKVGTAVMMQNEIKRIASAIENYTSKPSTTFSSTRVDLPGCSVAECLSVLGTLPGVEVGDEMYMFGTRLFLKREAREMFVALPNDNVRVTWLNQELNREQSK